MWHPYFDGISLNVVGRISKEDASRQEITAREILHRFNNQPGLVLADEVGMGKTFVALAVAASVALSAKNKRRPIVVMVPPSLRRKWPQDFSVFREKCLPIAISDFVRAEIAESAVDLLRLLHAPLERRCSLIFLTHGAMHRGLTDGWIKLAIIQRALHGRHHTQRLRRALSHCAGRLLRLGWVESRHPNIWDTLLDRSPDDWLMIFDRLGIHPDGVDADYPAENPVPDIVIRGLRDMDFSTVYEALQRIPKRQSVTYGDRVDRARQILTDLLREVWRQCLRQLTFRLPLLVMDEAHHLKNPGTRLSTLFQVPDAESDAEEVLRGALGGVFERMLFLTATPFQLGHHELCSVLHRFEGIAWNNPAAPAQTRQAFRGYLDELRDHLDAAQLAALNLDAVWGQLRTDDLSAGDQPFTDVESWWRNAELESTLTPAGERARDTSRAAFEKIRVAEKVLRPWIIRHLKPRFFSGVCRREDFPGAAIVHGTRDEGDAGLEVTGSALLPFLLAARATACSPTKRPVFAEGLASSYEAFLHTRQSVRKAIDLDDDFNDEAAKRDRVGEWYLTKLQETLPLGVYHASASHPKIAATAHRVLQEWRRGEKVLIFCHYVATGRALRQVISRLIRDEVISSGAKRLGCSLEQAAVRLERLGQRFFDRESPVRRQCDLEVGVLLERYPSLRQYKPVLLEVSRRYLRTPSFLVRYFPLEHGRPDQSMVKAAFETRYASNLSLSEVMRQFFEFLETQCGELERTQFLEAIQSVQTGAIAGREALSTFTDDELQGQKPEQLFPNVRLVNGDTESETRQRLMLTFNSPFFPEVLIASSVLAEGVDLQRFCRFVIHHDLSWNPSTLEQRTGRVDRIGAKMEQCGQPIHVYLPYLSETQDEKMYRVVMDRERWFRIVMGESFKVDARTTERLAARIPLPTSLAERLAFRLELGRCDAPIVE